uniref:BCL2 binding component 3 n=1 Tax=Monopterus albus TaxID=43700 RepID=A0A3Q3J5Y0_MONAL
MARAETIESVGETGGGNTSLPGHNTCRMELPQHFHPGPSLLTPTAITNGSRTGAIHLQHNHHHLYPLQAFYLSLPYPHPEGQDEPQTHQQLPALLPSAAERRPEASIRQEPLPDLLPQNEHPSWAFQHHRAARGEASQEVRRVASQLRAIGDDFNATVLRRHAAPHWRDWRDACRGLVNFITQTLSTLYRLT